MKGSVFYEIHCIVVARLLGACSERPHLCLQSHQIVLEAFVFLDIALYGLQITTELLRDARVLLLHAGQSILNIAVEPMQFTCTTELLITSFHLCQKSLPAIPTASTIRPYISKVSE